MASSAEIEEFLSGPLVAWLKTCVDDIDNKLDSYENYFDGFPFRDVLLKIDPQPNDPVPTLASFSSDISLVSARTKIFYTVFNNIETILLAELNQVVVKVPDILNMAQDPSTKEALEQLQYLLLLLLGLAVQGPTRQYFVERITSMPGNRQEEVAKLIQQCSLPESKILAHIDKEPLLLDQMRGLAKERDSFLKHIVEESRKKMMDAQSCVVYESEKEHQQQQMCREANHLSVEIVDYKSQIRRLRQTIDERNDNILELNEELEKVKAQNEKLENENRKLNAEKLKNIRSEDEWEALKEKASQAEFLEKEAFTLRRNLIDAKSNKNRIDELFSDNKSLQRNIDTAEAQLEEYRVKLKAMRELEKERLNTQKTVNDLELDLEASKSKIEDLEKRVSELQQLLAVATQEKEPKEEEDSIYQDSNDYSYNVSIQEELNNTAESKVLQLQFEKRQLQRALDNMEQKLIYEKAEKFLELEKDKKKLSLKCENLQEEVDRLQKANKAIEKLFQNTIEETVNLQTKVESLSITNDKQAHDLTLEKDRQAALQNALDSCNRDKDNVLALCDTIKHRADKADKTTADLTETVERLRIEVDKGREFERTNGKLSYKIESLEREISNLQKEVLKSKELLEAKSVDLDQRTDEITALERQLDTLSREKCGLQDQLEKLQDCEMKAQELLSQAAVHTETITTLQRDLVSEKVSNDKFKHNVERLGLNLDLLENDMNVVLEKMLDNLEVSRTLSAIYKNRDDSGVVDADRLEEMASSLTEEWRQEVERLQGEIAALQGANDALKKDNASLEVDVSTLRSQLQSLQVQQTALQLANSQLVAEKEDLSRQNQQQFEQHKTLTHDQSVLGKIHAELTTEYEKLLEEKESLKKSNRDLKTELKSWSEKVEDIENDFKMAEKEMKKAKEDSKHLSFLRAEHTNLKNDFRNLLSTSEKYKDECKSSREELKTLRTELRDLKGNYADMKSELANKTDAISNVQMENAVLLQKCEMLQENLNKLDVTRIALLDSFSELCKQSLACMVDSMDRQNLSQMEAKKHWEQYNNMVRQKERLEEKIFDFYKKFDNVTTKKGGFASLVRKVRKAGSGIISRSRSNRRSSEEETSQATPTSTIQAEPQVAGPSCSGSGESNNSSNGNEESDEDAFSRSDSMRRTPSGGPHGHRPMDEVALRRSQRQISRRNSVASEELLLRDSPSLGSIGSRRTVYISEDEPVPSPTPTQQIPQRDNNPPLLVYNRISTVIGNDTLCTLGNQTNLPEIPRPIIDSKRPVNPKETAVWYEYGCV